MLCYRLFHSGVDIVNTKDYIYTIYTKIKARKLLSFVLLYGIHFYVTPTQLFCPIWGVYSHIFSSP